MDKTETSKDIWPIVMIESTNCRDALRKVMGREPSEEQVAAFFQFVTGHLDSCLENLAASFSSAVWDVGYG